LRADSVVGHVVGLGHEHQRSDARDKVKFDCLALSGYEEAKKQVEEVGTDEPMFTPNTSIKDRMELVQVTPSLSRIVRNKVTNATGPPAASSTT